jgi:hypothetical protein
VRLRRSLFQVKPSFNWRPSDYTRRYRSAWAANRSMLWPFTPAAEGSRHPDRNAQFEYTNAEVLAARRLASPSFPWMRRKRKLRPTPAWHHAHKAQLESRMRGARGRGK